MSAQSMADVQPQQDLHMLVKQTPKADSPEENVPGFARFITGGIVAGMVAVLLNQLWNFLCQQMLGISAPALIHPLSITIASLIPILLGSLIYFLLRRITARAKSMFVAGSLLVAIASTLPLFIPSLAMVQGTPVGFALLAAPMHLIAGITCAMLMPRFVEE